MAAIISCVVITTILVIISGFCITFAEEFAFSDWTAPNWKTCAWKTEPVQMLLAGIGKIFIFGFLIPTFLQFCAAGVAREVLNTENIKTMSAAPVETYELTTVVDDSYLGIYNQVNFNPSYVFACYDDEGLYQIGKVPIGKTTIITVDNETPYVSISKVIPTNKFLRFFFHDWMIEGYEVTFYLPTGGSAAKPCQASFSNNAIFYKDMG